jgi:toxin FitB
VSYLLDTNVLSEWRKPRPDAGVIKWLLGVYEDDLHISAASIAELAHGVERLPQGKRREELGRWLEQDVVGRFGERIIGIDQRIASLWGRVVATRGSVGAPISVMDAFIAATALERELTLVTRNEQDFKSIGLTLINPWR